MVKDLGAATVTNLDEIVEQFQWADSDLRLEMLLDFSRKLPALPQRFWEQRDAGLNRVPECMTPVFLFTECEEGSLRLYVDVAEESPTVRGIVSILVSAYDGADPKLLAAAPSDLLNLLGLGEQIRMSRAIGVAGIVGRIKKAAHELVKKRV